MNLHSQLAHRASIPLAMALATPTPYDPDTVLGRGDGLIYDPINQRNGYPSDTRVMMSRSTCHRRNSTGLVFFDNDRQQDD